MAKWPLVHVMMPPLKVAQDAAEVTVLLRLHVSYFPPYLVRCSLELHCLLRHIYLQLVQLHHHGRNVTCRFAHYVVCVSMLAPGVSLYTMLPMIYTSLASLRSALR